MQSWHPDIDIAGGPKYIAIATAMLRDVEAGRLAVGQRLPPQRDLAQRLGVDLTTVTRAYEEARRLGVLEADGRRGSFVRAPGRPPRVEDDQPPLDTGMNMPPDPAGAIVEAWSRATAALLSANTLHMHYQPAGGSPADRAAGAALLGSRGVAASADTVLVSAGGQHALHAVMAATLEAGDGVAVGAYVYPGFLALARRLGLKLHVVATDEEGLDPDALSAACALHGLRAIYVVPTNDNPTAVTMGDDRRAAVAAVARRNGLTILEDDAYGQLPAAPLQPLAAYAPERTWHIASVSKVLSPGLRVAYLRAPTVRDALRLAGDLHETAIMASPLSAAVVTEWLADGTYARLIAQVREEARWRRNLASTILAGADFRMHPEGYHLWLAVPGPAAEQDIANTLRPAGLSIVPAGAFAVDQIPERRLRVSIGGAIGRERLERTLNLLEALLGQASRQGSSLV
jgi:DNA-binding transcriptional MocR family regulator